jgi:hypothetical protein
MGSKMYRLCQAQAFPIRVIGMVLIGLYRGHIGDIGDRPRFKSYVDFEGHDTKVQQ